MNSRTLCLLLATLPLVLSGPVVAQQKATTQTNAGAQANVPTKTLRLNVPVSAGNPINENIQEFRREVERRTGGGLKVVLGRKEQVYEDNEVISAVSSGAIEMGATSLNQFAYDVPLAGVFLQPFMFNYDALVRAAAKPGSEIRTLIDDEILYWTNARVLWWQPRGSTVIFSRKVPDFNPTTIVNRSVGAPDDLTKELTKACGGSPHLVPTSDLYSALDKESIQITMADIFSVTERDLWRVADTIVNTKHSPSLFIVVINDKVWEGLSESHKKILSEAAAAVQERMWDLFAKTEADAYAFAAKKGMKVYDPSPREVIAWRECTAPLLESYVDRIGDLGPKLFAAYGRLRTDPCCNNAVPGQMPFDLH
jgi:C4-dicarboxylate-binding protein DctP